MFTPGKTMTAAALATALPLAAHAAQGKDQLAGILGVETENYTVNELVALDAALRENDRETVELLLQQNGSGMTPTELMNSYTVDPSPTLDRSGKQMLAATLNVPAEPFTLMQLVRLDDAIGKNDETVVRAILDETGVDMTAAELMSK